MPLTRRNQHGLTLKEDKFCARYFAHGIAERAYREAYNASAKIGWVCTEAKRLLQRPEIQSRIAMFARDHEMQAVYDHTQAMEEAHETYLLAQQAGDHKGMAIAVTLKAKLSGLIIDRVDVRRTVGEMSDEDLKRERERINDELRAQGHAPLRALPAPRAGITGPAPAPKKPTAVHRE